MADLHTPPPEQIKPASGYPDVCSARRALIDAWVRWLASNPHWRHVDIEAKALSSVILELAVAHKASQQ